jgi:hypothetical protein
VVISVSAAVPAPQQLKRSMIELRNDTAAIALQCLLNIIGNVMDLGAVFVDDKRISGGSGVSAQNNSILQNKQVSVKQTRNIRDSFGVIAHKSTYNNLAQKEKKRKKREGNVQTL